MLEQLKEANIKVKNKMVNTEKPSTKAELKKSGIVNTSKKQKTNEMPIAQKTGEKKIVKKEIIKEKIKNKKIDKKQLPKKTEAIVNGKSIHVSTKQSIAVCKFIKNKTIDKAIADLEQVILKKKAVPMKGEIAHKKGKIMSGKYFKKCSEAFIILLKSLKANSIANGLENPIISEAIANNAQKPYGKFGRIQRKRAHIKIKAIEKKIAKKNKNLLNKDISQLKTQDKSLNKITKKI